MTPIEGAIFAETDNRLSVFEARQQFAQQTKQPFESITDEQLVQALLLNEPSVDDCTVLVRETNTLKRELLAYVVLSEPFSPERLNSYLQGLLPIEMLPSAYIPLPVLPLTAEGQIDRQALTNLEVIDADLMQRWEKQFQTVSGIEQVAVVVQERTISAPPLHLSDLLPQWKTVEAIAPEELPSTLSSAVVANEGEQSQEPAISHGGILPDELDAPTNLSKVLQRAAHQALGERIVYLQPDGSELTQSYRALLEEAERILAGLRKLELKPQDKVIFQLELNQDIIPAFWGCILGGFIPVIMGIAPTYQESNSTVDRLCNVWKLLDQPLILTSGLLLESVQLLSQWLPSEVFKVSSIDILRNNAPDHSHHPSQPDDLAFFNLTSGSTGMPKCIALTHRNLISRARGTNILCQHTQEDVILNWLPFDHIGSISDWHIRCVYLGCHLIYALKEYILGCPLNWMDLINQYRITHSWAPNFAYALVNDALKQTSQHHWDLSCVKSLLTAGEAVSSKAVEEFIQKLSVYGFKQTAVRPAFGMAEMGSGITYYQPTIDQPLTRHTVDKASLKGSIQRVSPDHPNCTTFTDLGPVIPGVSIRIVDGENSLLSENTIGYLQVKGDAVSPGYYKNPEVNKEVFLADGWFNTGDLGFISNGHLVVTGRAKETIIINGANYYNHEIEAVVEEVEGVEVSYTVACAVRDAVGATEKLAIFFSAACPQDNRLVELLKTIRQTVVSKVGLNPDYLIPLEKAAIPKTAIGKIQRSQLSKQFEAGQFDAILKQIDILLGNANTLPDWFYQKIWRPKEAVSLSTRSQTGAALVFLDNIGLGEQLCQQLNNDGRTCIKVELGLEFAHLSGDRYRLNPKNLDHYQQLLQSLKQNNVQITQVVHLWTYGEHSGEICDLDVLEQGLDLGIYSVLFLVQTLNEVQESDAPVRLLIVANHVQPISSADQVAAEKAPVLGLVKAASQEMPWLDCRHVDLPLDKLEKNVEYLLRELHVIQVEQEVAYRDGQRLVPRLEKVNWNQASNQPLPFKQSGMYLISGGLGGLGIEIAKYLLQQYGTRLLLVGRTPLPDKSTWDTDLNEKQDSIIQRIEAYRILEQMGGEIRYEAVDVGDIDTLRQVVERAKSCWQCELDGVIHLAGTAPERSLIEETHDSVAMSLHPKVLGTLALHQLLQDQPNSIFISFSSLASFFGGALIGAYAAANNFLDYFSHYQRYYTPVRSYCFAWGMWDGLGMSRNSLAKDLLQAKGYRAVSASQGLVSMFAGLHHDQGQLLVGLDGSNRNIQRYLKASPSPLLRLAAYFTKKSDSLSLVQLETLSVCDRFNTLSTCSLHQLQNMPITEAGEIDRKKLMFMERRLTNQQLKPRNELENQLVAIWQEVLGVPQVSILDSFFELGGTSLQAARLFAAIEKTFSKNLPLATLFQAPTIEQLAEILNQEDEAVSWNSLVTIQPNGSKPPLFCVHGAGGNVLMYRSLVDYLGSDQPLYGLQARGLDGKGNLVTQVKEMAKLYIQEIRELQPEGPYCLAGLSLGGIIAFEMAQLLQAQGQEVALLAMIDSHGPGYPKLLPLVPRLWQSLPRVALYLLGRLPYRVKHLIKQRTQREDALFASPVEHNLAEPISKIDNQRESINQEVIDKLSNNGEMIDDSRLLPQQMNSLQDQLDYFSLWILKFTPWSFFVVKFYLDNGRSLSDPLQKVQESNVKAMLSYKPQIYPGRAVLFRATEQPPGCYYDRCLGWQELIADGIEIHDVPGYHNESLLAKEKTLRIIGNQLKGYLDKVSPASK